MVALGLCRAQSQEGKCRDDLSLTCLSCEDSEEACCCRCPSAAWHQTLRSPACIYPHTHKVANLSPNSRLSVHGLHSRLWQELPDRDRHVGAKNGSLAEKCTRQKGENTEHAPHPGGGGDAALLQLYKYWREGDGNWRSPLRSLVDARGRCARRFSPRRNFGSHSAADRSFPVAPAGDVGGNAQTAMASQLQIATTTRTRFGGPDALKPGCKRQAWFLRVKTEFL